MKHQSVIVLAMHGMPPADFPRKELGDWKTLHSQLSAGHEGKDVIVKRYQELDDKIRNWPRTRENDLYFFASKEIAEALTKTSGLEVILGFNEFCAPSLDQALDDACRKTGSVTVITPMMTRGGSHSECDIPEAIRKAKANHPSVEFNYVWPFDVGGIARFLTEQMNLREKSAV